MSLGKSDPPPPPDYRGAAAAQGAANVQSAIASALLSRPNQITPYGSETWQQIGSRTIPGAEGNPAVDIPVLQGQVSLTPLGQSRLDQENRIINQLGGMAESGLGRVASSTAAPFSFSGPSAVQSINAGTPQKSLDFSGAPKLPGADDFSAERSRVEEALYSRLEPRFAQQRDATRTQLAVQGIDPGGEAANREYRRLSEQENDARMQAILAGGQEQQRLFNMGLGARQQAVGETAQQGGFANQAQQQAYAQQMGAGGFQNQARQQAIQEAAYLRSLPLNEVNALRTGNQVQTPQFQQYNQQVQAAPMFGATQAAGDYAANAYNAQAAQQAALTQGLFGLGGALAMGGAFKPFGVPGIGGIR